MAKKLPFFKEFVFCFVLFAFATLCDPQLFFLFLIQLASKWCKKLYVFSRFESKKSKRAKCPVLGVGLIESACVCGVRQTVMRDDGAFGSFAIFWLVVDESLQYYISFCSELNFAPKEQLRNIQFLQLIKLWAFFHFWKYWAFYCTKLGAFRLIG